MKKIYSSKQERRCAEYNRRVAKYEADPTLVEQRKLYFKDYTSRPENKERHLAASRKWKKLNHSKINRYHKKIREASPLRSILASAKARAKTRNLPFDLNVADIIVPERCPVLGMPLINFGSKKNFAYDKASIDRVDPQKGYVRGNIQVISLRANILKRDCVDPEELRAVADYIERNLKKIT